MKSQLTFVVLTSGQECAQELQTFLSADGRLRVLAMSHRLETVYAETLRWQPDAVILSLGDNPRAVWGLSRRLHSANSDTLIICTAQNPTPEMILGSLRAGACEFLRLPIIPEEFNTVLGRVQLFSTSERIGTRKRGRVVAVHAGKGGSGTSFVAANLAASLDDPSVLLDLDWQFGDQDIFFGVKPQFSLRDLVVNWARLDDDLLTSFMTPLSPHLKLLAAPLEGGTEPGLQADQMTEVIHLLRGCFDYIILDIPPHLEAANIAALEQADEIVLVFTPDLLSARGIQRSLRRLKQLGHTSQKIKLVVNRWEQNSSLELAQIEQYLGARIACCLSNDYPQAIGSINQGKPAVQNVASPLFSAEVYKLASVCGITLTPREPASRPRSFASLFRRFTSPATVDASPLLEKV